MEDAHHFGLRWICENAITRTKPHCKDRQKIPYIYTHSQSNLMFISFAAVVVANASQFYINFLLFFIFFIRNAWMHVAFISRLVPLKREEKHYHAFKYRMFASSSLKFCVFCVLCSAFRGVRANEANKKIWRTKRETSDFDIFFLYYGYLFFYRSWILFEFFFSALNFIELRFGSGDEIWY